jgi:CBS domain-containing protein
MNVELILKTKGTEPIIVGPEEPTAAVARLLARKHRGLALVCDADETLVGVVSVIDISRSVGEHEGQAPQLPVAQIMSRDFVACGLTDSVEDVLHTMTEHEIRHLPVVENGALKGLLTLRGVLDLRFEEAEVQVEDMRRYVSGAGYH